MTPLPRLMVAPNGARLGKADHPALPITLEEVVATAKACHAAGADGLHLHLRDQAGEHILDSGLYRKALRELSESVPEMAVQITTEAVGRYGPEHQRDIALKSGARLVSTSIRELMIGSDAATTAHFFDACKTAGIGLQIILYDLADLSLLKGTLSGDTFNDPELQVLFVLGRYSANRDSCPKDLQPFLDWMDEFGWRPDWAVCAFGRGETACLEKAHAEGGKLRVGFENSFWSSEGIRARDNAERVREIADLVKSSAAA